LRLLCHGLFIDGPTGDDRNAAAARAEKERAAQEALS
jgi:hypothetical protein